MKTIAIAIAIAIANDSSAINLEIGIKHNAARRLRE